MIVVDLHNHTLASHAKDSVTDMVASAKNHGLRIYGFSEHSPRPLSCSYPREYREHLKASFGTYVNDIRALQGQDPDMHLLLGMELDWVPSDRPFMDAAIAAYPFEYVIGGIHFLDGWGFDFTADDWNITPEECAAHYENYFRNLRALAESGLVNIAAHPDIIKLFSISTFRKWLTLPASQTLIAEALTAIRDAGMAMEISSAGLRKPCHEIYPGPEIMRMAADLGLQITFGSDAHNVTEPAFAFDQLEAYARSYGYTQSVYFEKGVVHSVAF